MKVYESFVVPFLTSFLPFLLIPLIFSLFFMCSCQIFKNRWCTETNRALLLVSGSALHEHLPRCKINVAPRRCASGTCDVRS